MDVDSPILAICIPTFNRCDYLENMLRTLGDEIGRFSHSYEIIISDNASEDGTGDMVGQWLDRLPIRYFRQDTNIGPERNIAFAYEQSQSRYSMFLADDDLIDVDGLNIAIEKLLSEPEAVALYAPWTLVDLVNNRVVANFYELPNDLKIMQGNFLHMLSLILQHHIFAEISIFQTAAFRKLLPRTNEVAHWAFTIPAAYLSIGNVIFLKTPFYKSVTNYFPGKRREQLGATEVETSWDSYRGGLEYLMGFCMASLTEKNIEVLTNSIREFVILRMVVALKIRINKGRDPIESYYLAARLRGLGAVERLPKPFNAIRSEAALWFVTHDPELIDGMQQIALVGGFDTSVAEFVKSMADLDIVIFDEIPDEIENAVLVLKAGHVLHDINADQIRARSNKIVLEEDLLNKFL